MREMSTDRPDKTESPYTVDAGHFQLEMDILNYSYDRYNVERADVRSEEVGIGAVNLKLGILNQWDLQWILPLYTATRFHDLRTSQVENRRGFGDMVLRSKFNLWGNDSGSTALAFMPALKLPTNTGETGNNSVEGSLIIPFGCELPWGWGLGAMTELDFIRNGTGSNHHLEFINTVTVGRTIYGKLGGYLEFFSLESTESESEWEGTVDIGFTYGLTENIQFDAGVNLGVTRSADDVNPFLGLSVRF